MHLPGGDADLHFGATTLTVDPAHDTLTAAATAPSAAGTAGTLSITIRHVSTSQLTSTDLVTSLHIADLSVFGTRVSLDGSVNYLEGVASVVLSGTLANDLVVAPGVLTIHGGTAVSLSTADGLTVSGDVDLGSGPARFTVALSGTITDIDNWSLRLSTAAGVAGFQPISGLTITPTFSGTVTDTDGAVRFDVRGDNLATWNPAAAVTVSVTHVEVSDQAPPASLACPAALGDGDIWLAASGELAYTPPAGDVHIDATAQACVAPAAEAFTVTTAAVGSLLSGPGFAVSHAILTVDGNLRAPSVTVKAAARIDVTAGASAVSLAVGISFGTDGTFVAAAGVPDLGALGLSGTNGFLYLASKEVKNFAPSDLGIVGQNGSDIAPFDLPAGVSVSLSFTLDHTYLAALQNLHIPISGATVQLIATLGESGFSVKIEVNFGDRPNGVTLVRTDQGITVALDTIYIAFDLSETSTTLSLGGTAYLHIPPVTPGGDASEVEVGVDGSINVETLTFSVAVSLSGVCHAADCAWHNAFGIAGLSLDSLSGTIGVDFETAIPTPTISLKVDNLVLPDAWARAIGMVPGTRISLGLNLSLSQPAVDIAIDPGPGSDVALTPLAVFTSDPDVVNGLIVHRADLVFAPLGATEADGTILVPGANLVFDTTIAGVDEHVAGWIDLSPLNPSFNADVRVASFTVGPVALQGPTLHVAIAPTAADISFSGGITDSFTGISFSAGLDLGVSTSLLNAAVSLDIRGGLPRYLAVDGSLHGNVTLDETGLNVSASGHLYLAIAGYYLSAISVSYSGNASTIWRDLNNDFAAVAAAFVSAYNWSATEVIQALQSLGFNLTQIAQAIADAFNQGVAWVITQFNSAGIAINDAVNAAIDGLGATATQVAAALQNLGYQAAQIAGMIRDAFNAGSAQVYNALVSIGDTGTTVINAIGSLFNNGSYNLWVGSAPDVLDVDGASQSAGASLIQYTWNGGTNQDWFVLPTDSGYAELVNRNSGQCLDTGGSVTPSNLVQEPCTGSPTQQWYLGVYPGSGSLNGQQHVLTNRYSGLVADVTGASFWPGASVEQYYANGGSNQQWTFLPAA